LETLFIHLFIFDIRPQEGSG